MKNSCHYIHSAAPVCRLDDGPLAGLRHRTVVDHSGGANSLALWQEEHLPGFLVPPHHHDCEEIITVIDGSIEAHLEDELIPVLSGESILIPALINHGFRVTSPSPVRLFAIFGSADPKIFRADGTQSLPPWHGGASNHLGES